MNQLSNKFISKAKVLGHISFPRFEEKNLAMYPIDLARNVNLPSEFSDFNEVISEMIRMSPVKEGIAFVTIDAREIKKGETHRRGGAHTDGNYIIYKDGKPVENDYEVFKSSKEELELKDKLSGERFEFKNGSWVRKGSGLIKNLKDSVSKLIAGWSDGGSGGGHSSGNWKSIEGSWKDKSGDWKNEQKNGNKGNRKKPVKKDSGHRLHYVNDHGGLILASSVKACRGWEGEFNGIPLEGGCCDHLSNQMSKKNSYELEENTVYVGNSTFVHESLPLSKDSKRILVRITLPHWKKVI